jgi:preprotein translocase SecE subunit
MAVHREDQGRLARTFAFWALVFFAYFAASFLRTQLASHVAALATPIGGLRIPIIAVDVSGAFLISAALFAGLVALIWRWQTRPKVANLLVETESEMRKVTWPTTPEVVNASIVVIVCVLFLMGFLAGVDWFFGRVFQFVLL